MLKYFEGGKLKTARTELRRTAEFAELSKRVDEGDPVVLEALKGLDAYLRQIPEKTSLIPNDHYEKALDANLRRKWAGEFKDDVACREMFGLLAWLGAFHDKVVIWVASPPEAGDTAKRYWSFRCTYELNECVFCMSKAANARIIGGPRPDRDWEWVDAYFVRLAPMLSRSDPDQQQFWVPEFTDPAMTNRNFRPPDATGCDLIPSVDQPVEPSD